MFYIKEKDNTITDVVDLSIYTRCPACQKEMSFDWDWLIDFLEEGCAYTSALYCDGNCIKKEKSRASLHEEVNDILLAHGVPFEKRSVIWEAISQKYRKGLEEGTKISPNKDESDEEFGKRLSDLCDIMEAYGCDMDTAETIFSEEID